MSDSISFEQMARLAAQIAHDPKPAIRTKAYQLSTWLLGALSAVAVVLALYDLSLLVSLGPR